MRITDEKRTAAIHHPAVARDLIRRGVTCDTCPHPATVNVHDGETVRFLCERGFLEMVMARRQQPRVPALVRVQRLREAVA